MNSDGLDEIGDRGRHNNSGPAVSRQVPAQAEPSTKAPKSNSAFWLAKPMKRRLLGARPFPAAGNRSGGPHEN